MISASQQKLITSLHVKKYRQKYLNFLVEGEKMVGELIQQQRIVVNSIFGTERWADANAALLNGFYDKFNTVTEAELKKVGTLVTPNQVLAIAEMPQEQPGSLPEKQQLSLYLDGIQDPGNMGTILRIADWFGIKYICCGPGCVDIYSPKVVQSSMGALFRLTVAEDVSLENILKECPGYSVCGAVMDGENIFKCDLPSSGILVIGNEGKGIHASNEQFLTHRVTIPGNIDRGAESLNAGVAAGIIVAEMIRRRG